MSQVQIFPLYKNAALSNNEDWAQIFRDIMKTEDYTKKLAETQRDYAKRTKENNANSRKEIERVKATSNLRNEKLLENSRRNRRNLENDYIVSLDKVRSGTKDRIDHLKRQYKESLDETRQDYAEKVQENNLKTNSERKKYHKNVAEIKDGHRRQIASVEENADNKIERNKKVFTDEQRKTAKSFEADKKRLIKGAQDTIKTKRKAYVKNLKNIEVENNEQRVKDLSRYRTSSEKAKESFNKSISELERSHANQQETKTRVHKRSLKDQHDDYSKKVDKIEKNYAERFKEINEKNTSSRKALINRQREKLENKNREHFKAQAEQRVGYKNSIKDLRNAYEVKEEYSEANKKKALVKGYDSDAHEKEIAHATHLEKVRSEAADIIGKKGERYRDALTKHQRESALEKSELRREFDKKLSHKTNIFRENLKDKDKFHKRQLKQADLNKKEMAIALEKSSRAKVEKAHADAAKREERIYDHFNDLVRNKDRNHELKIERLTKETTDKSNNDVNKLRDHISQLKESHSDKTEAASREKDRAIRGIRIANERRVNDITDEFNKQTDNYTRRSLENKQRQRKLAENKLNDVNRVNKNRKVIKPSPKGKCTVFALFFFELHELQ